MSKEAYVKTHNTKVLNISIQGDWTARDFSKLFESIQSLYGFYYELDRGVELLHRHKKERTKYAEDIHSPLSLYRNSSGILNQLFTETMNYRPRVKRQAKSPLFHGELLIKKVTYSSPGVTDFLGIAKVIEQLKEILFHYIPNQREKQEVRLIEQERIALQIKNLTEIGFSSTEIKQIILLEEVKLNKIGELLSSGKIQEINVKEK